MDAAELIVHNARVTTLREGSPEGGALAVRGEKFLAVGGEAEVMRLAVTGGDVVYAAAPFEAFSPAPLAPVSPSWSPVATFGGYQRGT